MPGTHCARILIASLAIAACGDDGEPPDQALLPALADNNITASAPYGSIDGASDVDDAGNAVYRIPIVVPPGVNGIQPDLAFAYSSGGPDGYLGAGWRLSGMSTIRACKKTLAHSGVVDPPDGVRGPLCLDGDGLVLESGAWGEPGAMYRPRHDPSIRVKQLEYEVSLPDELGPRELPYFKVYDRDGQIWTYGAHAILTPAVWISIRFADDDPYVWALDKIEDRFGNALRIEYDAVEEDVPQELPRPPLRWTTELLPKKITYTDAKDPLNPGSIVWGDRVVEFLYDNRPVNDQYSLWADGVHEVLRRRMKEVRVTVAGVLTRTYRISYTNTTRSGRSVVQNITGYDGLNVPLPSTQFVSEVGSPTMTAASWPGVDPASATAIDMTQVHRSLVMDVDHDGHDELLFSDGTYPWKSDAEYRVWDPDSNTLAPIQWAYGTRLNPALAPAVADINGDQNLDILLPQANTADCGECLDASIGNHSIGYASELMVLYGTGTAFTQWHFSDGSDDKIFIVATGDFDGDTLTDAWMCRGPDAEHGTWVLALNRPSGGSRTFEYEATDHFCAAYEWYEVIDRDGDGDDELLVRTVEGNNPDLATANIFGGQTGMLFSRPFGLWDAPETVEYTHTYEVLERWASGIHHDEDSGLPLDLNQRLQRDACHPAAELPPALPFGTPVPIEQVWPYFFGGPGPDKIGDVNGDGLDDVIRLEHVPPPVGDDGDYELYVGPEDWSFQCRADDLLSFEIQVWISTGRGFVHDPTVRAARWDNIKPWDAMRRFDMITVDDRNADGRADLISPNFAAGAGWLVHLARPGGTGFVDESLLITAPWDLPHVWEWNGADIPTRVVPMRSATTPAMPDLVAFDGTHGAHRPLGWTSDGDVPDHLVEVRDGLGAETRFTYAPASDPGVHIPGDGTAELEVVDTGLLVREMSRDLGLSGASAGARAIDRFTYYHGLRSRRGNGWLGFGLRRVESRTEGGVTSGAFRTVETWDDQSADPVIPGYPRAGMPIDEVVQWTTPTTPTTRLVRWTHCSYDVSTAVLGFVSAPHAREVRVREYESPTCTNDPCRPTDLEPHEPDRDTNVLATWDEYGNPLTETTTTPTSAISVTTTPDIDVGKWLVSRAKRVKASSTALDHSLKVQTTDYTYAPGTPAVRTMTVEPDVPDQYLQTTYDRDARGLIRYATTTDSPQLEVRQTEYQWHPGGYYLDKRINPLGQDEQFVHHDGLGVVTHYYDVGHVIHETLYDGFGRVTGHRRRAGIFAPTDGADVTIDRLPPSAFTGSRIQVRESSLNGSRVTHDLDRLGREIRAEWRGLGESYDGHTVFQETTYDEFGEVFTISKPQWIELPPIAWSLYQYDRAGRITQDLEPTGLTRWSYDHIGTKVVDPDGKPTTYGTDDRGDVYRVTDALGTTTCLDHGAFGLVERVQRNCNIGGPINSDPVATTTYTRDNYGRVTETNDTTLGRRRAWFDAYGQRWKTIDGASQVVTYHHDHLGRRDQRSAPDGLATWTWDTVIPGQLTLSHSADGIDRIYSYDTLGRVHQLDTVIAGEQHKFVLDYDTKNRLWKLTYPTHPMYGTFRIKYEYDFANYLRAIKVDDASEKYLWRALDGTPFGSIHHEWFGNGAETIWNRDAASDRLGAINTTVPTLPSATVVQNDVFHWYPGGDLRRRSDLHVPLATQYEDLEYDDDHQLTRALAVKGGSVPQTVGYDRLGNIKSKSDVGTYTYDPLTLRLKKTPVTTYTWNGNGELLTYNGANVTFTTAGRVKSIAGAGLTFAYDADGVRVKRSSATAATITLDDLYERTTSAVNVIQRFLIPAGGRIVAEVDRSKALVVNTTFVYLHADHLGSPSVITNEGLAATRIAFDPWGVRRDPLDWTAAGVPATVPVAVGFTGHQLAPDGAFTDAGARLYEPKIGRFVSPDPVVVDPEDGLAYAPYAYARNNPLTRRDPTGLSTTGGSTTHPDNGGDDDGNDDGGVGADQCENIGDPACSGTEQPPDDLPTPPEMPSGEGGGGPGAGGGEGWGGGGGGWGGKGGGGAGGGLEGFGRGGGGEAGGEVSTGWSAEFGYQASQEATARAANLGEYSGVQIENTRLGEMFDIELEEPEPREFEIPEPMEHERAERDRLFPQGPRHLHTNTPVPPSPALRPPHARSIPLPARPLVDPRRPRGGGTSPAPVQGRILGGERTTRAAPIAADITAIDLIGRHGLDAYLGGGWLDAGAPGSPEP